MAPPDQERPLIDLPILFVDNDEFFVEQAIDELGEFGWKVQGCTKACEAEEFLTTKPRCLIVSSYELPENKCLELLKTVDQSQQAFIVLTEVLDPQTFRQVLRNGADDYVFKPIADWKNFNHCLEEVRSRLFERIKSVEEQARLSKLADWQAWKAGFLKKDQEHDMQGVLRMLHVQFNQDTNFAHLFTMLSSYLGSKDDEKSDEIPVPRDFIQLLHSALRPVARLSEGVGIAASLIGDKPLLRQVSLLSFLQELRETWEVHWSELAKLRYHNLDVWIAPDLKKLRESALEIDREVTFKAINELVVNAFKHSDAKSDIRISFSGLDQRIYLTITNQPSMDPVLIGSDHFYGLPREYEAQAFRFFYCLKDQAAYTIYDEDWPLGLGLPLVKEVFEAAKGDVQVRNELWHLSGEIEPKNLVTVRASLPLCQFIPEENEEDSKDQQEESDDIGGLELF